MELFAALGSGVFFFSDLIRSDLGAVARYGIVHFFAFRATMHL